MGRYKSNLDACFGAVLIVAALIAIVFSCATLDYDFHVVVGWGSLNHIQYPLGFLLVFIFTARYQLFHSGIRWWTYFGLMLPSLYVIFFENGWFYNELHDFALMYFRSHGRFGCHDEQYGSYIFRDDTAPWILFGSFVLIVASHWILRSSFQKKSS
jgi:hypothetical protein